MCRAGYYKNPGVKQSRSARYGPGIRTEEQALSIVLSWMSKQSTAAGLRVILFFCLLCILLGSVRLAIVVLFEPEKHKLQPF